MKIYELIYYWDDIGNGTDITKTLLLTNEQEVSAKIEEFKKDNSNAKEFFTNYDENSRNLDYIYFTGFYYESSFRNLEIREHTIKI